MLISWLGVLYPLSQVSEVPAEETWDFQFTMCILLKHSTNVNSVVTLVIGITT